jgi:endonuclease III
MPKAHPNLASVLDRLQAFYGPQQPSFPVDPYEFLVWWHCGYPQSEKACQKGWDQLTREVGIDPDKLLRAPPAKLASALKAGGMVPELRAQRLKEIARLIQDEFGGDLRSALTGPLAKVRKTLKRFPGIADPGADRILLFAGIAPIAAVPSNCVHVPTRIRRGAESKNYSSDYRDAQSAIAAEIPEKLDARVRAYLLLKRHGQETCKRTNPKCEQCPISSSCAYFAAK